MPKFPVDVPLARAIKTFESLGFQLVREGNHISMTRKNADGSQTPLTMPNHRFIKGSTLRSICSQVGISRDDFLAAYDKT
jgi:predicted RNA binding protein YcfA (HicA-like mRNA interferase family)